MRKSILFVCLSLLAASIVTLGSFVTGSSIVAQETLSFLSTKPPSLYHQAATELKDVLKKSGFNLAIKEQSPGSFQNLIQLGNGGANMTFAQQDALYLLRNAGDKSIAKLADNIKIFAPVNAETIHVIVNSSSGIKSFADLKGKNVSVGPENSGTYVSAIFLYQLHDIDVVNQSLLPMEVKESIEKVRTGELDAAFYTAGIGNPLLKNISAQEGATLKLLPINQQQFKIPQRMYTRGTVLYNPAKIPANTYPWQKETVNTVASTSFIFVNKSLPSEQVYKLAKATYPQAPQLRSKNPFWSLFSISEANSPRFKGIDYHPGVRNFLKEQ
ncbi:TAXI family TRAP transporter solute-binding subunit [Chlorogloeopsis fritschii PCC 9212]|uniref:C4-dicarboxylate ABC transporter n=1 Tax=Chlorogloeopsis fritschii PCC 6912 TaxID=211165 RepID=A0A3S0ZKB6_CHLFR|nr:TAXI family TRAP transporter solute-binding subunit [Chlorogloeopsis fritschii]MBF2006612.1 TAXI family TRAP transporter solute-binding subunit [Chlorogloeopsis fritschii C42_A2020_084]RUR77911.1 C4-dicarboxylate ABC transporter [Chlorogloeopsis fritschii PCC 6912]